VKKDLDASISGVLKEHREYLQKLDDKFYERFSIWVPFFTIVFGIVAWVVIWHFDKTRKEALENFKSEASAKLDAVARAKVTEIVNAENLRAELHRQTEELQGEMQKTTSMLIKKAEQEISNAKDRYISDNLPVVIKTLEQSMEGKFANELNILKTVEQLQRKLAELESQVAGLNSISWGAPTSRDWTLRCATGSGGYAGWQGGFPGATAPRGPQGAVGPETPPGATAPQGSPGL